jgi:hypothetical protein
MRHRLLALVAAGVLAVPSAASAQEPPRDTGKPENPGCYGESLKTYAQTGLVGEFVSTMASENFQGNDGDSVGEDGVPFFKAIACPGDYRGRNSLDDQP